PDRLIAAKHGAGSVVVGLGRGEMFIASDIPAILSHTRDVVILEDGEVAVVTAASVELSTLDGEPVQREPVRILWDPIMAEKGGYRHFMLKEIYEQPRAITDTFRGRIAPETASIVLPDVNLDPATVRSIQRVTFVAWGTAWHASMLGRSMVERLAGLPAEVDLASEFRYRDAIVGPETLVVAVSQSGETADTLGAVKAARLKGCPILAITNVVGSALSREATGTLYMHAGPELGVASPRPSAPWWRPAICSRSGSVGCEAPSTPRTFASASRTWSRSHAWSSRRSTSTARSPGWPGTCRTRRTSSTSGVACSTPSRWRARSSSRSSPTSTPRATRAAR